MRLLSDIKMVTQLLDTTGTGRWSADNKFLFYVAGDENHRPDKVMRHRLGTQQSEDVCLYASDPHLLRLMIREAPLYRHITATMRPPNAG